MPEMIKTINLTKIYGEVHAVDNLNLSVEKGEILGFLGLNGAGKTTAIRLLLGMIRPNKGRCYIKGHKVTLANRNIWQEVGYIVETPYSYPELTVKENLEIVCKLRGIRDNNSISWIMGKLKLDKYATKKVKHLSLGNAQRLGLAKAIIHKPKILLLDEPTNGLDPSGIVEIRQLLINLAERGVAILMSSHKLDETSKVATNIAIIHEGKLIKKIDNKILESQLKKSLLLDGKNKKSMLSVLTKAGYQAIVISDHASGGNILQVQDRNAINNPDIIATRLVNAGYPPTLLKVEKENLEEYFLRVIKEGENDRFG